MYQLYGLPVKSDLKLNAPLVKAKYPQISIRRAPSRFFHKLILKSGAQFSEHPIDYQLLDDGSVYIRFFDRLRFWVSKNGRLIFHEKIPSKQNAAAPHVPPIIFLQTNVLSFSLIKLGYEAFHASAVKFEDKAVAFLGESGYGKSTLAACFFREKFDLLTDDIFAIQKRSGSFWTPPGVPQIKLWPTPAKKFLKHIVPAGKMSPIAKKLIFRLKPGDMSRKSIRVGLIYVLWPRFKTGGSIRIKNLKPKDSVIALIKSSHNLVLQDSARLQQQLRFTSKLVQRIPIRAVSYPMDLKKIGLLQKKLQKDIKRVFAR